MHLTVGVFGDPDFAKELGKKGTEADLRFYNHGDSSGVLTFVEPATEKVATLIQAIGMVDVPVIIVNAITKEIGEILIACDNARFEKGFLIVGEDLSPEQVKPLISGSSLEKYEIVEKDAVALREKLKGMGVEENDKPVRILVDQAFVVKSVGTVVLGIVKQGKVKAYENLVAEPAGTKVLVKSIQSQDKNIQEAVTGTRVGLSVKGPDVSDLGRGTIICPEGSIKKGKDVTISFEKDKYFSDPVDVGKVMFLSVGVQVTTATVTEVNGENLKLSCEHEVAYDPEQKVVLAKTDQKMPRIIGHGKLL